MWKRDIEEYCLLRDRDPQTVEAILLRKGWNANKYHSSMRNQLFDFLDKWYTLSVKNLPEPATKRNPIDDGYIHITKLPGGRGVHTFQKNRDYVTQVFDGKNVYSTMDTTKDSAHRTHLSLVERLLNE